jgi:peroxiredoxin
MKSRVLLWAAAVVLLAAGCSPETQSLLGTKIQPLHNAIPGPGDDVHTFTTAYDPYPDFYTHTIAEEVAAHKPFILLFATPAHCTQCQNQIDTVHSYHEQYKHAFDVIHIDEYKNGNVYTALGVRGDPWTFLIDATGTITGVYPGVTTWDDMDPPIRKMLGQVPAADQKPDTA